jgi:hypothetical protein
MKNTATGTELYNTAAGSPTFVRGWGFVTIQRTTGNVVRRVRSLFSARLCAASARRAMGSVLTARDCSLPPRLLLSAAKKRCTGTPGCVRTATLYCLHAAAACFPLSSAGVQCARKAVHITHVAFPLL